MKKKLNDTSDANELYFSYSLENHAYQMHIGSSYIDAFKQLYGFDTASRNTVLKEAIYPIFNAADEVCASMINNFEYKYSDDMILEVLDPIDSKVIYISKNGQKEYSFFDQYSTNQNANSNTNRTITEEKNNKFLRL